MACCPSSLFRCASGGAEFLAHARRASSYNVRGHMCALLERLIQNALEEETEGNPALTFEHWQTQTATGIARMGGGHETCLHQATSAKACWGCFTSRPWHIMCSRCTAHTVPVVFAACVAVSRSSICVQTCARISRLWMFPNKWALDDFLNLAAKILKQHGLLKENTVGL